VTPALVLLYLGLESAQRLRGNSVSSPDLHISLMIAPTDGA